MTKPSIPPNYFDRGKLFYPLVVNYVAQLLGIKELAVRGLVGEPDVDQLVKRLLDKQGSESVDTEEATGIRAKLTVLCGPLTLKSEFQGNTINVDPTPMGKELVENFDYLAQFFLRAASSLLILAHELTKDAPHRDNGPLWEFLRHCRNAAAHCGMFDLRRDEPRRPANWGKLEITQALNGTLLFKDATGSGLVSPGDPIRLLWDIEQAYPAMG